MAGPNPTFAECWAQAGKAIKFVNTLELRGHSTTPNLLDDYDALVTALDGEHTPRAAGLLDQARRSVGSPLRPSFLRQLWDPFLDEMVRVIGTPELAGADGVVKLSRVRQYMVDNSQTLNSRGMTLGSASAVGSPAGNGVIRRVTVDKDGYTLEATGPEVKTWKLIRDQTSGAKIHEEVFEVRGKPRARDGLQWAGSGILQEVRAAHAVTARLLQNPSWDSGGTADDTAPSSVTALTGWEIQGAAANFKTRSASGYTYGGYPGQPATPYGLEFVDDDTIQQVIRETNPGAAFSRVVPYYYGLAWQRKASATGTLTIHLGSQSVAATIGDGTNDQWNLLFLPLDENLYYDNFRTADLTAKVVVASLATGTVVVDDLRLAPFVNVDGTFYLPVGGSTPWLQGDSYTFTDADGATRAINSYFLWRAFGGAGWLPTDNGGTETITDPS